MVHVVLISALAALLPGGEVTFKKTIVDTRFVAEAVAVGDMDRDGKLDIVAGNAWYRAPDWKPQEIAPFEFVDPKKWYSNCFATWVADLNRDGWLDQILIGLPGEKAVWRENPKGAGGPWKEHLIWHSAGNESPHYEDLFRNGKKVLIMGTDDEFLAWFEPAPNPNEKWICHPISGPKGAGSQRYSHGLGVADLDGDGKNEVLTTAGYYTAPKGVWSFVEASLGPDCAQMLTFGGKNKSILTTSAHQRGVWQFEATGDGGYKRTVIDETISGTHSAVLAPLEKSGPLNLITGKRKWAHLPGVDAGSEEASWLVRYELEKSGQWTRHMIDEESGVGTQFVVRDMNGDGLADVVVSNKNGVFLFATTKSASR